MSAGVMAEIRALFSKGKSVREIINAGYKPGSVYGVHRQLHTRPSTSSPGKTPQARSASGAEREATSRPEFTVIAAETGLKELVWHPKTPVACPGCGEPVGHWEVCQFCDILLPGGCNCPEDSPSRIALYELMTASG